VRHRSSANGHPKAETAGFTSVKDLINTIRTFIDGWNDRCQPFTWIKTAEEILEHAIPKKRKDTSFTRRVNRPIVWAKRAHHVEVV
jgi:hypothetical protein